MKQVWQWEREALLRLGFSDTGTSDRQRAVDTVISLMKEIEEHQSKRLKAYEQQRFKI